MQIATSPWPAQPSQRQFGASAASDPRAAVALAKSPMPRAAALAHSVRSRPASFQNAGSSIPTPARENLLLRALPQADWQRWQPLLEWVDMPLGKVLCESGREHSHVYFPTTAIVSLHYLLENGSTAEFAVVGDEGVVGVSLFMGGGSTPSRAVVQSAGQGWRLRASVIQEEFERSKAVLHLLLRYTQALITQMAQKAVCNRHHSLEQQLCRFLLLTHDRLPGDDLMLTQELIANMLGVRREGVTEAALKLQRQGVMRYARGRITVLNRHALEKGSCECYAVVKREYKRLLPEALFAEAA